MSATSNRIDFLLDLEGASIDYILQESITLDGTGGTSVSVSNETINEDFTVFLLYEKTNSEASVLWSAYTESPESGYLVGVSASNKVFVTVFSEGERNTYTSDIFLASKNAIAISITGESLSIEVFDFNLETFLRDDFSFDNTNVAINKSAWNIGEDDNDVLDINNLVGNIDYFAFFNQYLNWGLRQQIFKAFYNTLITDVGGETIVVSGIIEGAFSLVTSTEDTSFEYTLTGMTAGETIDVYGWVDVTETVFVDEPYWDQVGTLESKCVYYEDQDVYVIEFATVEEAKVVGQTLQVIGTETLPGKPIYTKVSTGTIIETYEVIGQTEQIGQQFQEDGFVLIKQIEYMKQFGMDWVTYTKKRDSIDDWAIIVLFPDAIGVTNININVGSNLNVGSFRLGDRFNEEDSRIFLHGQLMERGDYKIAGRRLFSSASNNLEVGDFVIYDIVANSFTETQITQQSDFSNVPTGDDLYYFFNGQLLRASHDYTISSEIFVPSSELETETGIIISVTFDLIVSYATSDGVFYATTDEEIYSFQVGAVIFQGVGGDVAYASGDGDLFASGDGDVYSVGGGSGTIYDYRGDDKFPRNTVGYYLNGVRLTNSNYVEHSNIDLIPGIGIDTSQEDITELIGVNNDESGFWES